MNLLEMIRWPDEEWHNQKIVGKDACNGLPDNVKTKLHKAMQFERGGISKSRRDWDDLLGYEKPKIAHSAMISKAKIPQLPDSTGQLNGNDSNSSITPGSEAVRPKRMGRKRRYDDFSFEGYGEGYVDDDVDTIVVDGFSTDEGDRKGGTAKKRKKVCHLSFHNKLVLSYSVIERLWCSEPNTWRPRWQLRSRHDWRRWLQSIAVSVWLP